ncbi:MAG: tetratricopeptide repeat protein, partial [Acidobacteriota bacterium]
ESLGARWVIHGSYVVSPASGGAPDLRIQLQISDAASGEVLGWARERGRGDEVLAIVQRLLTSVTGHLSDDDRAQSQDLYFQGRLASSAESLELFARGAEALSRREAGEARGYLERAAAIDADNSLNHSLLAVAYEALGLQALAAASADRSAQLARELPWEYRTSVAARAEWIAGRCEKAVELLEALRRRMPGEISYGARLSESQACAGRLEEALETLRSLRVSPLYGITDVNIDIKEVRLLVALRRLGEAETLVSRAIETSLEKGAPVLAADGLVDQFWIRFLEGRWVDSEETLERLDRLIAPKDARRLTLASAMRAALRHRQGRMADARVAYDKAVTGFRRLGDLRSEAASLNNYASLLNSEGDQDGVIEALSRSIEIKRGLGERSGLVMSLSNLANIHILRGDLDPASALLDEAMEVARDIDDPHRLAVCLRSQGRLAEALGDLDTAESRFQEALALSEQVEETGGVAWSHRGLGDLYRERGEEARAADHLRRAIVHFEGAGDVPEAMATRCRLADLEVSRGGLARARELYTEVLGLSDGAELLIYRAEARQGLAAVATEEGHLDVAEEELLAARDLWREAGREEEALAIEASLSR